MDEIRVLAPTAQLGAGFLESSFERGLSLQPHVIACDSGSTDSGPHALGAGGGTFPDKSLGRDLKLMLKGRARLGIPLVIGSCGTSGSDLGVKRVRDLALKIAEEEGLHFKLAVIHSEQDRGYLKRRYREGRIRPLTKNAPELSEAVLDNSAHIVGMMGHEPIAAALAEGADVVLAGRSSDTSLFSAFPLLHGASPHPVWHCAKIMECGASASVNRKRPDSMFAWIREDHFDIEPLAMDNRVSPQSIASHTLYENGDPHRIREPGGIIETLGARYEQITDRSVRVYGSKFLPVDEFTIKLEGAELVGYQNIIIGGVRDPYILRQLDTWLEAMTEKMKDRVAEIFDGKVGPDDYSIHTRVYGRDGTMGEAEPRTNRPLPHEVGLVFTVTAATEEISAVIAKSFSHLACHYPIPEWGGLITGIAFPYSPASINRGPAYRFSLNHVVVPDDPLEMFPTEYREV